MAEPVEPGNRARGDDSGVAEMVESPAELRVAAEVATGGIEVPPTGAGGPVEQPVEGAPGEREPDARARIDDTPVDRSAVLPAEPGPAEPGPTEPLAEAVAGLAEQLQAHHARAEARERVIDHLHAEVERLRLGAQGLLLRPVVADLQNLRREMLHQARTLPEGLRPDQTAALLESFALSVEQTLERCGTVPIRPRAGDPFDARRHRAVKALAAAGPEEDTTIAEVLADGYLDTATGRVTEPARVHVRRWREDRPDTGDQGEGDV
ncbi:nucleotide exchange factor GrpE [Actinosynnema sp. NPDC059797]